MEELRGYLWPLSVYARVKGEKPGKNMSIVTLPYNGRQVKGVLLDESHGRPVGSIAILGHDDRFVNKDRRLASLDVFVGASHADGMSM